MISKRAMIVFVLITLGLSTLARGFWQVGFGFGNRNTYQSHTIYPPPIYGPRPGACYAERYYWTNRACPKYYGGLHATYFQSLGVPPGDIGLRTNGIHLTPW